MAFVRTVTGDVDAAELGVCYAHEHIMIDPSFTTFRYPDFLLDSVDLACADVLEFRAAGGKALIDSMPCGGGRNAIKLAEIANRTSTQIVCPTGLHLQKYYPPGHWGEHLSAEEIADLFIAELEDGIDARDYNGPSVSRTEHRAGLIKVATSGKDHSSRCKPSAIWVRTWGMSFCRTRIESRIRVITRRFLPVAFCWNTIRHFAGLRAKEIRRSILLPQWSRRDSSARLCSAWMRPGGSTGDRIA